jgi:hypothetical protein
MPMTTRREEGERGVPRFVCLVSVWTVTAPNYFLKAASSVCITAFLMQTVRPSAAACGRHSFEHFPVGTRRYDTVANQSTVSYITEFGHKHVQLQIYNIMKLIVLQKKARNFWTTGVTY